MASLPAPKPKAASSTWTKLDTPQRKFYFAAGVIIVLQLSLVGVSSFVKLPEMPKQVWLHALVAAELLATVRLLWIIVEHPEVVAKRGLKK